MTETLTPLAEWCDEVGLAYHRGWRLVQAGRIRAVQLGTRWYVVGDGLPAAKGASQTAGPSHDGPDTEDDSRGRRTNDEPSAAEEPR